MLSLRLTSDLEQKLTQIAKTENISKSEIVKKALIMYFAENENKYNPYYLGNDLFGKFGSGKNNLSKDYKNILKGKLFEKHNR